MAVLDDSFLRRVYPVVGVFTAIAFLITLQIYNLTVATGVIFGGVFAILNTVLIGNVIRATVKPGMKDPVEVTVTLFLKFPVALGLLVLALWQQWIHGGGFVIGFTTFPIALLVALTIQYYSKNGANPVKGDNGE